MRNAVLIYNPKSGRQVTKRVLPAALKTLRAAGFEVEPVATRGPNDATPLAREAAADPSIEIAFAMGGDGTQREVARGLLGSEVALGPLPAGTTNVLALALALPQNALSAARAMAACSRRAFDVGLAGSEPFLMQVSAGLDAAVMARQDSNAKKRFGKAAVAWTGIGQWWNYDYPRLELRFADPAVPAEGGKRNIVPEGGRRNIVPEGGQRIVRVSHFAACNIPFYAGAFRMAPDADPTDRRLDLVLFSGSGRAATLGFARDLGLGRHLDRDDVEALRVDELELVGPPDCPIQIDGDILTAPTPVKISIAEERLWVMAPATENTP